MSEAHFTFTYPGDESTRLDKYLVTCLPDYSRARLQGLIKDGFVLVDGVAAAKAGQILDRPAQVEVTVPPNEPSSLRAEAIPLDIVYEDDDLMVVNKPAGMVVHPAIGHAHGTLVHAALAHAPEMEGVGGQQRPGVVHRLDKNTSGLILLAKNDFAHHWLQEQFRSHAVVKVYQALVDGRPPTPTGRIEAPIGREPRDRKRMGIVPLAQGRAATSEYLTLQEFPAHTLLEVHPITGRTHQIRVHLAFLGCPVVGDDTYGRKRPSLPLKRHFLHAGRLTIRLPRAAEARTFEAPLPPELTALLTQLKS
jgi:23S rRNA pseudouridine1911/1915/1917 synthase